MIDFIPRSLIFFGLWRLAQDCRLLASIQSMGSYREGPSKLTQSPKIRDRPEPAFHDQRRIPQALGGFCTVFLANRPFFYGTRRGLAQTKRPSRGPQPRPATRSKSRFTPVTFISRLKGLPCSESGGIQKNRILEHRIRDWQLSISSCKSELPHPCCDMEQRLSCPCL